MTNFRSLLRKVLPLRASVFEAYRKKESKRFDDIIESIETERSELAKLTSRIEGLEKQQTLKTKEYHELLTESLDHIEKVLTDTSTAVTNVEADLASAYKAIANINKELGLLKNQTLRHFNEWASYSYGYDFERTRLPEELKLELRRWYKDKTGKDLNLDNPRTYNEKIQWLKINGPLQEMGELADKYHVRGFVSKRIGQEYLVPLVGVWDDPSEIDFDVLPDRFVLKATHGSAWNIVVKDKASIDASSVRAKLKRWLSVDFAYWSGFELQYRHCRPRIIVEQYLENKTQSGESDLFDYKFWCFGGRVAYIQFLENRARGLKMAFYDRSWVRQSFVYDHPRCERDIPKPDNLSEMIVLAEKLAEGFPHVRVDFYRLDDGTIYFGEMTFTSMSGICRWDPPETDQMMGDLLKLPGHVDSGNQSVAMDDTDS